MQLRHMKTFRFKAGLAFLVLVCVFALSGYAQVNADEYRKTIEMADSYFSKGDYINAKASYQIAVRLAPEEQYPKDRLQQSLDMIKAQMYQNSLYQQKIKLADDLLGKNDLQAALKTYQEALAILPGESYATGKVQEITNKLAGDKVTEENYQKSIVKGDQLLKDGNLENALTEYRNASSLKPAETYPKEKITELEKTLADRKNLAGTYESLMQAADVAISHNKYEDAISNIEAGLRLKPEDKQASAKLAETKKLKADWDSYSKIITDADNLYISKDFEKAKVKYQQAQAIKPADEYPKRMIEKIDIALMDLAKADRSSYEVTIALADKLFNEQDYERAIVEYNNALRFKPDETYAKQRISDINNALNLRKTQEDAYLQSIAKADKLYNEQLFEDARDEYNRASGIKPLEQYPKVKVDEINTMLSKLASQRGVYNNLIKGADRLFFSDEYVEAREQYRQASDLFPKEQYPLNQITMINEILGIRDKYDKAVTKADLLLSDKKYDEALLEFRNAASISPKEEYPVQKIKEIETIVAYNAKPQKQLKTEDKKVVSDEDNAMTAEEYQEGLAAYQKEKVYEVDADSAGMAAMASNDQQYDDIIGMADSSLEVKNYQDALAQYQAAIKLKPGELYAHGKIDSINKILAEIAAKEEADKKQAELALQEQQMKEALAKQQQEEALAKQQQEEALAKKKQEEALAKQQQEEVLAKQQQQHQAALDKEYSDAISNADAALQAKDYQKALAAYQSAVSLKPDETYAPGKITEINKTLAEIAAKEAAEKQQALLEQQQAAALDKQYSDAIAAADKALQVKDYRKALTAYQTAASLKPDETYAPGKITEINKTLDEIAAKDALEKQQEALDKQYADLISTADNAFTARDYQNALIAYQSALNLKPNMPYVKGRMAEINGILADIAAKEEIARKQAALDKQYTDALSTADIALQAKDYQKALNSYQSAKSLKPDEPYAQDKIKEINIILGEVAAKEALDKHYAEVISGADLAFQAKQYDKALAGYEAALNLKPGESYAKDKIKEVEGIKEEQRKQAEIDNQYNKIIASADDLMKKEHYEEAKAAYQEALAVKPSEDLPNQKIAVINQKLVLAAASRDLQYQAAISEADASVQQQDFDNAKKQYEKASALKPDEAYPKEQIKIAEAEIAKKMKLIQAEYDKTIVDADQFYKTKIYDNALESYRASSALKPDEAYPKEMAGRILKLLGERSIVQINKDPLVIASNTEHKFTFISVPVKDRKSNYIFFRARNVSKSDYKLYISYGKDQVKNGGFVVKVPAGQDLYEFIVRISAQYKWFSDDNNWITFYPEGGDFEVSLMQISYSD
jgi:tetratricopeptide (TPR) repeat protein